MLEGSHGGNYGSSGVPVNDADDEEVEETGRRCCTCAHPIATFFHLFFKLLAIGMYLVLYLIVEEFVICFVLITLCVAFDFWTTKNVTGRLMVGLRWWNDVSEDGKSTWRFETLPDKDKGSLDPVESMIFWGAVLIQPLLWIGCFILCLFSMPPKIDWAILVAIAVVLVAAQNAHASDSGTCGENCNWYYDSYYDTLTISGESMDDYDTPPVGVRSSIRPWNAYADYITLVQIDYSVKKIGSYAFANMDGLEEVTYTSADTALESIGEGAFENCSLLSVLYLADTLTTIGSRAFKGCSSLKSLTIPEEVTSIGSKAFAECSQLSSVTYLSASFVADPDVFEDCPITNTCVNSSYVDPSFGGITQFCRYENCLDLDVLNTSCTQMACVNGEWIAQKRDEIIAWEEQSTECVNYSCDCSDDFNVQYNSEYICFGDAKNTNVCMGARCGDVNEFLNKGAVVIIDIDETPMDDVNNTELKVYIASETTIKEDTITVTSNVEDTGYVIQVVVYVEEEEDAKVVAQLADDLGKTSCTESLFCHTKSTRIIVAPLQPDPALSTGHHDTVINMMALMLMMIIAFFAY